MSNAFLRSSNPDVVALANRLRDLADQVDHLGGGDLTSIVVTSPSGHVTLTALRSFLDRSNAVRDEQEVMVRADI